MLSTIMVAFDDAVASHVAVAANSDSPAPLLAPFSHLRHRLEDRDGALILLRAVHGPRMHQIGGGRLARGGKLGAYISKRIC
jgi:hypothetical protein